MLPIDDDPKQCALFRFFFDLAVPQARRLRYFIPYIVMETFLAPIELEGLIPLKVFILSVSNSPTRRVNGPFEKTFGLNELPFIRSVYMDLPVASSMTWTTGSAIPLIWMIGNQPVAFLP